MAGFKTGDKVTLKDTGIELIIVSVEVSGVVCAGKFPHKMIETKDAAAKPAAKKPQIKMSEQLAKKRAERG